MRLLVGAVAFAAVLTFPALAGEKIALVDVFATLSRSVGALYSHTEGGDMRFLCTATAVGKKDEAVVVLTAHHCVDRGSAYLVTFDGQRFYSASVYKLPHYVVNEREHPRAFNEPETDMAMFLVSGKPDIPMVEMSETGTVLPGTRVAMVSYPLGAAKVGYEGIVSGYFDRPGANQYNYLLLQIFAASGSSGGAVVDVNSKKILGVLVSGKSAPAGLPILFATPIHYQRHLMEVSARLTNGGKKPADKPKNGNK